MIFSVKTKEKFNSLFKTNQIIQFMTYSDILIITGWGFLSPIVAVYITNSIKGGNIELVGLSTTVYFLTKCTLQIPVARFIDKRKGERDDFVVMVMGTLLISFSAFAYMFIKLPWHVYVLQFVSGLGAALSLPGWIAIFTRHVDKNAEALQWSLYYTATDVGAALSAGLGAFIAATFGYQRLFFIVGVMSLLGTFLLMHLTKYIKRPKNTVRESIFDIL